MYKLAKLPNYPICLDRSKMSYIAYDDENGVIKFSFKVARPVLSSKKRTLENQLGNLILEWGPTYQVLDAKKVYKNYCHVWLKKVDYKLPTNN